MQILFFRSTGKNGLPRQCAHWLAMTVVKVCVHIGKNCIKQEFHPVFFLKEQAVCDMIIIGSI